MYLTDRGYSVRRPLISDRTSILKKMETEKDVTRNEENQKHIDASAMIPIELTLDSCNCSHSDISSFLPAREDLRSPLCELRASVLPKQHPHESPFVVRRSAQQSLSSSILEVQQLNTPLQPPLTSTVLYPRCTPCLKYSRRGLTGHGGQIKFCFSEGPSKGHKLSVHQLNYRACAVPKSSPPSTDRCSEDWDPNQEYQVLLDYTYPLRPEQERSVFKKKSHLQDSGIEMDRLCISNSLSGLSFYSCETEQTRAKSTVSGGQRSLDQQVPTDFSKGLQSRIQVSQSDPISLCVNGLHNKDSMTDSRSHQHQPMSSCPAFVCSTNVLPWCRDASGEVDDEFWHLPLELEELKLLSRQVRAVTSKLEQSFNSSCGLLGPHSYSSHSSISVPINSESEGPENSETGRNKTADHKKSESLRRRFGELTGPDNEAFVQDVNILAEQMYILNSPRCQQSSQENSKQSDSLLQHFQMFRLQLEKLTQQLYSLSEKMKLLATTSVHGVKSAKNQDSFFSSPSIPPLHVRV